MDQESLSGLGSWRAENRGLSALSDGADGDFWWWYAYFYHSDAEARKKRNPGPFSPLESAMRLFFWFSFTWSVVSFEALFQPRNHLDSDLSILCHSKPQTL